MQAGKKALSLMLTIAMVFGLTGTPYVFAAASNQTAAVESRRVMITNNADNDDIVYITAGLRSGHLVRIYEAGDSVTATPLFESDASKGSSFRFMIPAKEKVLDDKKGGEVDIRVKGVGKEWSEATTVTYKAALASVTPREKNVVVTDSDDTQRGVYDRVNLTGLRSGDVFYVYYEDPENSDADYIAVSSKATTKGVAEAELKTPLPAGDIWVTVKSTGRAESPALLIKRDTIGDVDQTKEPVTAAAINNVGAKDDKVMVTGLYPGDFVEILEENGSKVIGKGTVAARRTEIEIKVTGGLNGGKPEAGSIIIRVTTAGKRVYEKFGPFAYESELASDPVGVDPVSSDWNITTSGSVTIWNYENRNDDIEIRDLIPGDKIVIKTNPEDPQKATVIKTATVSSRSDTLKTTLRLPDIPEGTVEGSVLVYRTSVGMGESAPAKAVYSLPDISLEPVTDPAATAGIIAGPATNSAIKNADEMLFTGSLGKGDKISVYAKADATANEKTLNAPGSGTVNRAQESIVVLVQFPTTDAGIVYVTYTKPGKAESKRTPVSYGAEEQTNLTGISFKAVNLAGSKDTLTVAGAPKGAVIQAYATSQGAYSSSFINGSYLLIRDNSGAGTATLALPALAADAASGTIYAGITMPGKMESQLYPVSYGQEPVSESNLTKMAIRAVNNYGSGDSVVFSQLILTGRLEESADMNVTDFTISNSNWYPGHTLAAAKTVINLYATSDPAIKGKIGSLTIDNKYPTTATTGGFVIERTVAAKGFDAAGGTIFCTLTYPGQTESGRIEIVYPAEGKTDPIAASAVTVDNRINTNGEKDFVTVNLAGTGLGTGAVIKIYTLEKNGVLIAKEIVTAKMAAAGEVTIGLTGKGTNILPENGPIWVSVQDPSKSESDPVSVDNMQSGVTTPAIQAITELPKGGSTTGIYAVAVNNPGVNVKDTIFVLGLKAEDTVTLTFTKPGAAKPTVYTVKVAANQSTAYMNYYVDDAAWTAGGAYITVTRKGLAESEKWYLSDLMVTVSQ